MKYLVLLLLIASSITFGCSDSGNQDNTASNDTDTPEKIHYIDPKAPMNSKVIATVNGIPIYEAELRDNTLQSVITDEILFQYGIIQGVHEGILRRSRNYKKGFIVRPLRTQIIEESPPSKEITDDEIEAYYNEHKDKNAFIYIQEITFSDSNIGNEIKKRAQSGEDFQTIAKSYNEKGTNVQVKDLGYNRKLTKHFENKEVGALSDIIEKDDGAFSLITIVKIRTVPLAKKRTAIRHRLEAQRDRDYVEESARQLAADSNIKVEIIEDSK